MKILVITLALFGCAFANVMFHEEHVQVRPNLLTIPLPARNNRIIGGANDVKGAHPYQVSLQTTASTGEWYHTCGGSIIGDDVILTAAHCIDSKPVSEYRVVCGEYDFDTVENTETTIAAKQLIIHPDWDASALNNDAALVKIQGTFKYGSYVGKITLADVNTTPKEGTASIVTGWGYTSTEPLVRPNILQSLSTARYSDNFAFWLTFFQYKEATQVAIYSRSGEGVCQGDSGGPLVYDNNGTLIQYGICSYGFSPCGGGRPDVFARVSTFLSWITSNK